MACIQHESDVLRVRVRQNVIHLFLRLQLAAQVRVNTEPNSLFLENTPAQLFKRLGHVFQILGRCPFRTPRAHVRLLMVTAQFLAEANHAQMVLNDRLSPGRILEVCIASPCSAGDRDHPDADFVEPLLEFGDLVRIIGAECGGEMLNPSEANFMRLAETDKWIAFPSSARIGSVADPVAGRLGGEEVRDRQRGP